MVILKRHTTNLCHWRCCLITSCSSQTPGFGSSRILTCYRNTEDNFSLQLEHLNIYFQSSQKNDWFILLYRVENSRSFNCMASQTVYLLMVKGCRAGCCLGIQIMLGGLRLGLPSPELPMLLVLPLPIPMPWPTWEWFSMFLEFIGRIPLWRRHHGLELDKWVNRMAWYEARWLFD